MALVQVNYLVERLLWIEELCVLQVQAAVWLRQEDQNHLELMENIVKIIFS